jgi:NAD-dependent SIR2 family protein deacetylase
MSLSGVAKFIGSDACKSVCVLTGAGISCAAGIPDFRSPGGMYDTLQPDKITASEQHRSMMRDDPVTVVQKGLFMQNQFPYHEVRRPFILGTQQRQWKATLAHRFLELLHRHGKLRKIFTQNIDGLDYQLDSVAQKQRKSPHRPTDGLDDRLDSEHKLMRIFTQNVDGLDNPLELGRGRYRL